MECEPPAATRSSAVARRQARVLLSLADALWPAQPAPPGSDEARRRYYETSGGDNPEVGVRVSRNGRALEARPPDSLRASEASFEALSLCLRRRARTAGALL